jgi:hypothetical protein
MGQFLHSSAKKGETGGAFLVSKPFFSADNREFSALDGHGQQRGDLLVEVGPL